MRVSIIIPVYNEERLIRETVDRVRRCNVSPHEKEIIIVNDGSTDRTGETLAQFSSPGSIDIITLDRNHGKAYAIKAAIPRATGDIILIQDADLEYTPEEYPELIKPFSDPSVKVVYGSRFRNCRWPKKMKVANWLANKVFTFVTNQLYNARITDEGTAYKVFRRDILESVSIRGNGFEFCSEVTSKLLKRGIGIVEVPISYEARSRKEGKKPYFRDGVIILWSLIKHRFID